MAPSRSRRKRKSPETLRIEKLEGIVRNIESQLEEKIRELSASLERERERATIHC
jgi:hypothetical protein